MDMDNIASSMPLGPLPFPAMVSSSASAEAAKLFPGPRPPPRPHVYLTRRSNEYDEELCNACYDVGSQLFRHISPSFHFSLFTEGVREAYLDSRLFDVRLVCADGLIFWAHSLVLSVFSDFFAEMARLNIKEINLGGANSGNYLFKWTVRARARSKVLLV